MSLLLGVGIWTVLSSSGNAVAMFLNGANVIKFQVIFATLMAISALGAKILLTSHIGIAGIPWGTTLPVNIFSDPFNQYMYPKILSKLAINNLQ